jgi:hypothetical protein
VPIWRAKRYSAGDVRCVVRYAEVERRSADLAASSCRIAPPYRWGCCWRVGDELLLTSQRKRASSRPVLLSARGYPRSANVQAMPLLPHQGAGDDTHRRAGGQDSDRALAQAPLRSRSPNGCVRCRASLTRPTDHFQGTHPGPADLRVRPSERGPARSLPARQPRPVDHQCRSVPIGWLLVRYSVRPFGTR